MHECRTKNKNRRGLRTRLRFSPHLVVVEGVDHGDESSCLWSHVDGHLGNVLDKEGVEMAAELQIISCTQRLQETEMVNVTSCHNSSLSCPVVHALPSRPKLSLPSAGGCGRLGMRLHHPRLAPSLVSRPSHCPVYDTIPCCRGPQM